VPWNGEGTSAAAAHDVIGVTGCERDHRTTVAETSSR
jgi:hypothetical protein